MNHNVCRVVLVWCFAMLTAPLASAIETPTLEIVVAKDQGPLEPGEPVTVVLRMHSLGGQLATGFQAFIEFDQQVLTFIEGTYTDEPFGLPILDPIVAVDGTIDMASGINQFVGQQPTSDDAALASLTFILNEEHCLESLQFRDHEPPTRISDTVGNEITPLDLVVPADIGPSPDINGDGVVNVSDLLILLSLWGTSDCRADFNGDGDVNVSDLLILLAAWG